MAKTSKTRRINMRSLVAATVGRESPYPVYRFSGRTFFERPNHNPFKDSAPVEVTTVYAQPGTVDAAYAFGLEATGGAASYTWALDAGALPDGLALSELGVLTGIPSQAGTFMFSVRASDVITPENTATGVVTMVVVSP